jgi:hypothetical protein
MKLLLENWRRFITENKDAGLCLYYYQNTSGNERALVLYSPKPFSHPRFDSLSKPLTDIGGMHLTKTKEPCIPTTYEVTWVYVNHLRQGQKYGKMLYDVAFYVVNSDNYGLTSDHTVGTMDRARKLWKAIESSSEYEKRETEEGHDEFDYEALTPDPNDDCGKINQDEDFRSATDHSLFKKNFKEMGPQYKQMIENHRKFESSWDEEQDGPLGQYLLDVSSINIDVYV